MDDKLAKVIKNLSDRELAAYEAYMSLNQPKLAPSKSAEFFKLFLNGKTCEEIAEKNKGFSLGLVVRARIEDEWDERKDRHLAELLENARAIVQQRQLESVVFLTDIMSSVHKFYGDKLQKYLQTGDEAYIQGVPLNLKVYKEILELLLKITGQDKSKAEVLHKHTVEQPIPQESKTLSAEQAAEILKIVDSKNE